MNKEPKCELNGTIVVLVHPNKTIAKAIQTIERYFNDYISLNNYREVNGKSRRELLLNFHKLVYDANDIKFIFTQDERILEGICKLSLSSFEENNSLLIYNQYGMIAPLRKTTEKELRDAHNLRKMYLGNSFISSRYASRDMSDEVIKKHTKKEK